MYPFTYKIEYYDEVDYDKLIKYGLLYANDYRDAMDLLGDYYGEEAISRVELKVLADGPIELPESLLRELVEKRENSY